MYEAADSIHWVPGSIVRKRRETSDADPKIFLALLPSASFQNSTWEGTEHSSLTELRRPSLKIREMDVAVTGRTEHKRGECYNAIQRKHSRNWERSPLVSVHEH